MAQPGISQTASKDDGATDYFVGGIKFMTVDKTGAVTFYKEVTADILTRIIVGASTVTPVIEVLDTSGIIQAQLAVTVAGLLGLAQAQLISGDLGKPYSQVNASSNSAAGNARVRSRAVTATGGEAKIDVESDDAAGKTIVLDATTTTLTGDLALDSAKSIKSATLVTVDTPNTNYTGNINLATAKVVKINSVQVLAGQQAAIADADVSTLLAQFNTLLAKLRLHGIIAT